MGMNLNGAMQANNLYAQQKLAFRGNGAPAQGQTTDTSLLEGGQSDLELLMLSNRMQKQEEKNNTAKTVGIIGSIALAAGSIWAYSRGKKLNAATNTESGILKNFTTGIKSFFGKTAEQYKDKVVNVAKEANEAAAKNAGNAKSAVQTVSQSTVDSAKNEAQSAREALNKLKLEEKALQEQITNPPKDAKPEELQEKMTALKKQIKDAEKASSKANKAAATVQTNATLQGDEKWQKLYNDTKEISTKCDTLKAEKKTLINEAAALEEQKTTLAKALQDAKKEAADTGTDISAMITQRQASIDDLTKQIEKKNKRLSQLTADTGESSIAELEKKLRTNAKELGKQRTAMKKTNETLITETTNQKLYDDFAATMKGRAPNTSEQEILDFLQHQPGVKVA